jgi:hypothetical protein
MWRNTEKFAHENPPEENLRRTRPTVLQSQEVSLPLFGLIRRGGLIKSSRRKLETKIAAVNPQLALRRLAGVSEVVKKSGRKQTDKRAEQTRRARERYRLPRVSTVSKKPCLKGEGLSLGKVIFRVVRCDG